MAVRILISVLLLSFCAKLHAQDNIQAAIPIGTGDTILIDVFNEPELSLREKIGQNGVISMPLVGEFSVIGKLPQELAKELSVAYEDGYLVNADVSVKVESYRSFYVSGSVFRPGAYEYVIGLTVEQAIAIAGGLRERASKKKWYILRGKDKHKVDVSANSPMMPGDILTIQESLF